MNNKLVYYKNGPLIETWLIKDSELIDTTADELEPPADVTEQLWIREEGDGHD